MPGNPCQFIDRTPHYEARDGLVYISMGAHCLAMPIKVFMDGCRLGQEAVAKWHLERMDEGRVIPLSLKAGS